jgi:NhaP-type Na+/H+ or K+/H+ antiporter
VAAFRSPRRGAGCVTLRIAQARANGSFQISRSGFAKDDTVKKWVVLIVVCTLALAALAVVWIAKQAAVYAPSDEQMDGY